MTSLRKAFASGAVGPVLRPSLAILPVLVALTVQLAIASIVQPSVWFLLYPAVFLSSWIGGLRGAITASALAAVFGLWLFVPPHHSFVKPPGGYVTACVFLTTGVFFGVFHDRLRRALVATRAANEALEHAVKERRIFAALIENSSDFIGIADPSAKPVYLNPAGRQMVGLTPDSSIENTQLLDYYAVDQRTFASHVILKAMVERGYWHGQTAFRHWQTQAAIPVSGNHFMIRDPNTHEVLGLGTITRDISDLTTARDKAERARRDLDRAQAVAQVGSWRLDVRRNELVWSDENYRIFGVPLGTPMTYGTFLDRVHPSDRAYVDREWTAALRGQPYDIEHRIIVNGTTKWVREKADLAFDEHQNLVGGIGITHDITERKLRDAQLHEAQERLELALSGADLGTWDWNIASGDVVFNSRWAEIRGYGLDEIEGRVESWSSAIHPEDAPRVKQAIDDYLEGQSSGYEAEYRVRTKSGDYIWILDRGKVFARDEAGKPVRMVGTELDITPRKRAEEKRRLAEAKASGIVSIAADAIISIDPEQRITLFNEGAEAIFGYTKAEAIGAPLDILLPERLRAVHRDHIKRFAAGETAARRMGDRTAVIVGRRKNGEEFPADASISKLKVDGTQIMTVALRDVTEQKRYEAEQSLLAEMGTALASTLELESILANIGRLMTRALADACIVAVVDDHGQIFKVNAMIRDPAQAWICDVLADRSLSREQAIWSELEANRCVVIEHVSTETITAYAQSDEQLRALRALDPRSLIVAPFVTHRGLVGAMALISTAAGRAYSSADVRFAEQIAQRAALAIDNARLYAEARHAIETRDEVLGVVAHDLRNPLGSIVMQAALLRRPEGPERRARKPADSIERSAMRMSRLIEDLLEVTRLEQGHLALDRSRLSVPSLVAEVVRAQQDHATAASLDLHAEVGLDVPEVWADRDRLLQIFENLIGNAMKFTQAGGIVAIGARQRGSDVLFWVADTGCGIAATDVPHVFDRFWQATKAHRRGAGLGLPIVKGLVESHGGQVWVESAIGRGSTFFFTIPIASPQVTEVTSLA